jgi:hypothetical protein
MKKKELLGMKDTHLRSDTNLNSSAYQTNIPGTTYAANRIN